MSSTAPLHFSDMSTDEFMAFLAGVDSKPPPESVLKAVAASFTDGGLTAPDQLVGVVEVTLPPPSPWQPKRWTDEPSVLPMLLYPRRQARPPAATIETVSSQPQPTPSISLSNDVNDLVGPDYSAAVVANFMAHAADLNEADLMSAAGFLTLSFQLRPDPLVWRVLHSENVAALARGRKPLSYVDLMAKELLPEARLPLVPTGVQFWIRTHPPASNLAQLGRSLHGARRRRSSFALTLSGRQRSTNTVSQPSPSSRSVGMPSLPSRTCSFKSWRKKRLLLRVIFLMVLYDDLFRRQLARRALAGETELDVNQCFQ